MRGKDQIQLRGEFLAKYGSRIFPNRTEFAVIGISLFLGAFTDTTPGKIALRSATWEQVCGLESHPQAEELWRYFRWKSGHSKTVNNRVNLTAGSPVTTRLAYWRGQVNPCVIFNRKTL